MRYLTLGETLQLYLEVMAQSGGKAGLRDIALLEACLAQPKMTFEAHDLYPSLAGKAAALCHSLIAKHPFVDGNKRIGQAATETFLLLNGYEISSTVEEQEDMIMRLASGQATRDALGEWLSSRIIQSGEPR